MLKEEILKENKPEKKKIDEALFNEIVQHLNMHATYHNNWAVVNGREITYELGKICYASMLRNLIHHISFIVDKPFIERKWDKLTEKEIAYIYWVVYASPWKYAFNDTSAPDVIDKGFSYNLNYNIRYLLQASILIRYLGEFSEIIDTWSEIRKDGFSEIEALLFSHVFKYDKENNLYIKYKIGNYNHLFIYLQSINKKIYKNILSSTLNYNVSVYDRKMDRNYIPLAKIWDEDVNPNIYGGNKFEYPLLQKIGIGDKSNIGLKRINIEGFKGVKAKEMWDEFLFLNEWI